MDKSRPVDQNFLGILLYKMMNVVSVHWRRISRARFYTDAIPTSSRQICVRAVSTFLKLTDSDVRRSCRRCKNISIVSISHFSYEVKSVSYVSNWSRKPTVAGSHSLRQVFLVPNDALRVLKYVKGAVGETDVPDALPEFISQRRRWLNGSLFAATYAIAHIGQVLRSGHSFARKTVLTIETIYNVISLIFSWFSIVRTHRLD